MKRKISYSLLLLFFIVSSNYVFSQDSTNTPTLQEIYKNAQTGFIENKGQIKEKNGNQRNDILFSVNANDIGIYLKNNGISYVLRQVEKIKKDNKSNNPNKDKNKTPRYKNYRFDVNFEGCNTSTILSASDTLQGVFNYFIDGPDNGLTNVKHFGSIYYHNLYNGIDLRVYLNEGNFKYDFIVHPGADISDIKMKYKGLKKMEIMGGRLMLNTPFGFLEEDIPLIYQDSDNDIEGNYILNNKTVSFNIEDYNENETLVIDPTLKWSTYFGGNNVERIGSFYGDFNQSYQLPNTGPTMYFAGGGIVKDSEDNIIITGSTFSNNFPASVGISPQWLNQWHGFISKFSPGGDDLLWSGYYSHNADKYITDIDVDSQDNIFVVGSTRSTQHASYAPYTPAQPTCTGCINTAYDAFVLKIDPLGTYSAFTYWGGSADDYAHSISINSDDEVIIIGETYSIDFPINSPYQSTCSSCNNLPLPQPDVFVAKFDSQLTYPLFSSYYGGNAIDHGLGVDAGEINDKNYIYITGATNSDTGFPLVLPTQASLNQTGFASTNKDAFVAVLDSMGIPAYSSYYGGLQTDFASGITTGSEGYFAITGFTVSNSIPQPVGDGFPLIVMPNNQQYLDGTLGGLSAGDAFITGFTFDQTLVNQNFANYLGGSTYDCGQDIDFNELTGSYYITGYSNSTDFPAQHAFREVLNRNNSPLSYDIFLSKYTEPGHKIWSTIYGSDANDYGIGIACSKNEDEVTTYGESAIPTTLDIMLEGPWDSFFQGAAWDPRYNVGAPLSYIHSGGTTDVVLATFNEDPMLPTYHGGTLNEVANGIVTDQEGYIYTVGMTYSTDFPSTTGVVSTSNSGSADIFITKLNNVGRIVWSTYYGGTGYDEAKAVDIDYSHGGDIYLTGTTSSSNLATSDPNCPSCTIYKNSMTGDDDGFVMRISSDGGTVKWFTYYGGNVTGTGVHEVVNSLALSNTGFLYVTGMMSDNITMVADQSVIPNVQPHQSSYGGTCGLGTADGFVAKFDEYGQIQWSTYWGGNRRDACLDIDISENLDTALVSFVGWTNSYACFPTSTGAHRTTYHHVDLITTDAFYSSLDSNGRLVYSTYFGGIYADTATCVYAANNDNYNDIYFAGHTESYQTDVYGSTIPFPIISYGSFNPLQSTHGNNISGSPRNTDGFVANIRAIEWEFDWSTYIGGGAPNGDASSVGIGRDLICDIGGYGDKLFITGGSKSFDSFTSAYDLDYYHHDYDDPDDYDSFVTILDTALNEDAIYNGSYYGEDGDEISFSLSRHLNGTIVYCGSTTSDDLFSNGKIHNLSEKTYINDGTNTTNSDAFINIKSYEYFNQSKLPTFVDGSGIDGITDMIVANDGSITITGFTYSTDFPITVGTLTASGTNSDIFASKLDPSGEMNWLTTYGGSNTDEGFGIAEDSQDYLYITGNTLSSNLGTTGVFQQNKHDSNDAFLMKLNSDGTNIEWFTYFGDDNSSPGSFDKEWALAIDVNDANNPIIVGETNNSNLQVTNSSTSGGGKDIFIAKFSNTGSLAWSTYFGGIGNENCYDISNPSNTGYIAVVGVTQSNDLPTSYPTQIPTQSHQANISGTEDGFMTVYDNNGNIQNCTYYGGTSDEFLHAVKILSDGYLVAGCSRSSNTNNCIATNGALQTTYGGGRDVIVVKFNNNFSRVWGTYLGGSGYEDPYDIALKEDSIYVVGNTQSANNIATSGSYDESNTSSSYAMFLIKINNIGTQKYWGTYLGENVQISSPLSVGYAVGLMAMDIMSDGQPIIAGTIVRVSSNILPVAPLAFQNELVGSQFGYIAKLNWFGTRLAKGSISENILGNEVLIDKSKITIHPNPTKDILHINAELIGNEVAIITIADLRGNIIFNNQISINNKLLKTEIDVSNIPSGTYILKIYNDNNQLSKFFIKM